MFREGAGLERVDASTRDACAFCDSVIAAVILHRLPQVPRVVPSPTPYSLNISLLVNHLHQFPSFRDTLVNSFSFRPPSERYRALRPRSAQLRLEY